MGQAVHDVSWLVVGPAGMDDHEVPFLGTPGGSSLNLERLHLEWLVVEGIRFPAVEKPRICHYHCQRMVKDIPSSRLDLTQWWKCRLYLHTRGNCAFIILLRPGKVRVILLIFSWSGLAFDHSFCMYSTCFFNAVSSPPRHSHLLHHYLSVSAISLWTLPPSSGKYS